MEEALISIIVPVYNTEQYLVECLNSIVMQTYKKLEIILVDDGSKDHSLEICNQWQKKDERISVIHKKNGGAASARNAGLDVAQGQYIGFVDSDDIIAEDMFECLYRGIQSRDVGIADCGIYHFTKASEIVEYQKNGSEIELNAQQALNALFTLQIDTSFCCKLFDHSVFRERRFLEGETNEEFPLLIPMILTGKGVVRIPDCKYFYRQREGSVTQGHLPNTKVLIKNLRLMEDQLKQNGIKVPSFGFFAAQYSLFHCLKLEKRFDILTEEFKADYRQYRSILWKNALTYMFSPYSTAKNKIFYLLVLTKLLRPLYKVLYRDHL